MWTSFVEQDSNGTFVPSPMLNVSSVLAERNERKKAAMIKSTLIDLAAGRLVSKMGHKFMSIVLACLTCLDKTDSGFGDEVEFTDEDGIVVGVRYIEKVSSGDALVQSGLG